MRSNPLTSPLRAALVAATTLAATGLVLTEAPTASAALFLVDTLSDDPADGYTLREAVADANAAGGLDIIGFDPALDGTIVLDGAPISIEDSVEIDGDDRITISGAGASRIFISFVPGTDLTVTGMTLTEGWSPADGGAIDFFQGNDLTLERVTVTDSHSVDDGGGLAVHATTGTVMIEDSAFIGNRAINGDGGGMVFTDVDVAVLMVDTVIHDNESTAGEGGGLFADTPNGTFQSVGIEVTENRAPIGLGGGLSVEATFVSLDEAHVSGNSAAGLAGVKLESLSANTNLTGVAINDNDGASFGGGGMIVASSVAHVHDAEVHGNQSAESSGLVVLGGSGVSIQDGSFIGNDASGDGGALTIVTTPTATIERTTIADNTAMTGPALRAVSVESLLVEESTLSGNDATTGNGGAILAAGDPSDMIELFATTVSGNSAGDDGGAIWAESVKVHAVASTIVENSALGSGGGAFLSGPAELHADNSIVVNDAPTAPDVSGAMEPDHALIGDTTGTTVLVGPGLVTGLDPMLWPLADNGGPTLTHLPHPDSPVVDEGDPTVVPIPGMTDQRGLERFVDVVDLGSVERQPSDPVEPPAVDPPAGEEPPGGEEPSGGTGTDSLWIPVEPARIFDSRVGGDTIDGLDEAGGRLSADSEVTIDVAGRAGVPLDAQAVIANVTAIQSPGTGFATVHACETPRPWTASLNYSAGVNLGNEVIASLGGVGELCVYTSESIEMTVDVVGYVPATSPYEPVVPARLLDTRAGGDTIDGAFAGIGRAGPGGTIELDVVGRGGVIGDVAAVVMYIGAVQGASVGYVTAWDCDGDPPNASSLNHVAGINRGNEVVVAPSGDGRMCLFTSADVDLTVDVVGVLPVGVDGLTMLDDPSRLVDSRPGHSTVDGLHAASGVWGAGEVREIQIGGRAGVPGDAETVAMTITAVQGAGIGWATVFACNGDVPNASSVNFVPGVNGGNEIIAGLDDAGRICVFTSVGTHLTVDVTAATS